LTKNQIYAIITSKNRCEDNTFIKKFRFKIRCEGNTFIKKSRQKIGSCTSVQGLFLSNEVKMSSKLYKLHYLSQQFYTDYGASDYPEIEHKATRPYIILLVKIGSNTFGLPLRTNIRHSCCYKFKYSSRPTDSITGIDFSKAVVVNDEKYIGCSAEIDNKEYVELNDKIAFITNKFKTYLEGYLKYISGTLNEFQAKNYKYTTLKYFHKELGLD